ncbi:glycine cleavage system protein GcvH [Candidatus Vallotia cooleyia]|uniref:glycine cleavage system protein GcvH n=1 Tax=Candidatus Vallotiella adelgis TaxID=1177211 RepID=UPI001D0307A0|nr:glycine cleavage system protein GcvH [Candidatus Vallotia cooleyia]UDG81826.1 Glycine cleavage system H protein [Candidatus Vallotia cooleyia]
MSIPAGLKYTVSHEWVRKEDNGTLTIGITDHAQELLGDVVFLELPEVGKHVEAGDAIAVIESVKAASDIYTPVAGKILNSNDTLISTPNQINNDPYESWLFSIKPTDAAAIDKLLDAVAYSQAIGAS